MNKELVKREVTRNRRTLRVRKNLRKMGKIRLSVFKSNKHLFVQAIDDVEGKTIAAESTLGKGKKEKKGKEVAKIIGKKIAEKLLKDGIKEVVFDRGRFKYHGLIALIAEGAREGGLKL